MLTLSWLLTALSLAVAAAALLRARRVARRLDRLSESYWELRYESSQLKARVTRLEAGVGSLIGTSEPPPVESRPAATTSFIPLSSLKK